MKEKIIKVLKIEPMSVPRMVRLNNDLDSLQKAVSQGCQQQGLIEIIPIAEDAAILCNEVATIIGLEGNRRLGDDIIAGVFYIVGTDKKGNLCSLTADQMAYYNQLFFFPEIFTHDEVEKSIFCEVTDFPEER